MCNSYYHKYKEYIELRLLKVVLIKIIIALKNEMGQLFWDKSFCKSLSYFGTDGVTSYLKC